MNSFPATAALDQVIQQRHLLNHPFYQDWMAGRLSRATLQDYAAQYFHHVQVFPRYLSATHSLCDDSQARVSLSENLAEEEGWTHGSSHPELWLQFAEGVGAGRSEVNTAVPRAAIQNVVQTFFRLSRGSYASGLGAIYAYESQIPEIAESKIQGLRQHYSVTHASSLAFFEVHRTADVEHRKVIRNLLDQLSESDKQLALAAAESATQALWDFLSDVHSLRQNEVLVTH